MKQSDFFHKNVYFVILCGGSGTRLWPLSRKNRPKQLLPFLNNKSLLEQTIDRISTIAYKKENIGIITTKYQEKLINKNIKEKIGFLLKEPVPRNTGPAILYSCLEIEKKNKDATVVFLASDPFIPDTEKYCFYLKKAIEYGKNSNKIVTLGLIPTRPATGYGYIQANEKKISAGKVYDVKSFHEKPNLEKAKKYLEQNNFFWNLGMFVGKVQTFLNEYKIHAPEMFCENYESSPSISIDYAIMEKSKNVSVVPCDFEWTDVGNLETFLLVKQKYEKPENEIINIDSKNNIAQTNKKIVSFIGVENLCVIEDGDVIVVAKRDQVEKIKQIHPVINEEESCSESIL